jgi:hypothetical protein
LELVKKEWETDKVLGFRLQDGGEAYAHQQEALLKEALIRLVGEMDVAALTRAWLAQKQRPVRASLLGEAYIQAASSR